MFETALEDNEIITAVSFPVPEKAGYAKVPNPASRYAVVGVLASRGPAGIRVAVTGAGPCVFRSAELERALSSDFTAAALDGVTVSPEGLNSDIHAGAEYRAHLVGVLAKRAVAACG
jgi:carbon-monoxide dehydrogenase medium subunit